jgi:glyoxylase-like metal-dependent hydrolase (beta-lactamase superfamily II)
MSAAFKVGQHKIHRVEEWQGHFAPPEMLFSGYDAATFAREAEGFTPDHFRDGMVYGFIQSWLIEAGGKRILFDTGAGNNKSRPNIPVFGDLQTDFMDRLAATGFNRHEIDIVVCSHLHIDHVGWNTMLVEGKWIPAFPNARYIFPAHERAIWDPAGPHYAALHGSAVNAGVFEDSVQPILDAGHAELIEEGYEILPGLTMRNAPGHTPGQMLLDMQDGGERALFIADVIHHPMEVINTEWNSVYCEDQAQARATRRAVLEDAAATGARVVPAHLGGKNSIFIARDGTGFRPIYG